MAVLNLNPISDAYVSQYYADTNFGSQSVLFVDRFDGYLYRSLLKFDLSALPPGATITAATLTLQVNRKDAAGTQTVTIYKNLADFTENGVTWNNEPAYTTTGAVPFNVTAVGSVTGISLLTMIQGWYAAPATNFGVTLVGVEDATNRVIGIDSKSGTVPPVLSITYSLGISETIPTSTTAVYSTPRYVGDKIDYSFGIENTSTTVGETITAIVQYSVDGINYANSGSSDVVPVGPGYKAVPVDAISSVPYASYVRLSLAAAAGTPTAVVTFIAH